jgi:leucyl aminopeptidase
VKQLKVTMTGTGDADLYVRRGQNPTVYTFNCSSVTASTSNESCTVDVASGGGIYYVRARTRTPDTSVSVVAEKVR